MLVIMTVLAGLAALALAMSIGYQCGRRVGSTSPTWRKRTSRVALGRRALNLAVLIAARRIDRRLRAEPMVELFTLRVLAPLRPLRGSATRTRAYRGAPGW